MAKKATDEFKSIKPYLKWPGSKTKLINKISKYIPEGARRLIEPFAGSGSVAFNLHDRFKKIILADANSDLMLAHETAIQTPQDLISDLALLFNEKHNKKEEYLKIREEFNNGAEGKRRASLFIYLNRHCFNGLCRYSSTGKFNTPFGQIANPYLPFLEIAEFSTRLGKAKLSTQDFREVFKKAKAGDFIYCDPPYAPLTETANFTAYSAGGFSSQDQKDLAHLAEAAAKKGATVVVSNHDTKFTREIYKNANHVESIQVSRSIAANGDSRKKAAEILAVFLPEVKND